MILWYNGTMLAGARDADLAVVSRAAGGRSEGVVLAARLGE